MEKPLPPVRPKLRLETSDWSLARLVIKQFSAVHSVRTFRSAPYPRDCSRCGGSLTAQLVPLILPLSAYTGYMDITEDLLWSPFTLLSLLLCYDFNHSQNPHSSSPAKVERTWIQTRKCLYLTMDWSTHDYQWNVPVSLRILLYGLHSDVKATVSNGATFMPNTFTIQEFARISLDEHLENLESGRSSSEPIIYSVKKGRPELAQRFAQSLTASRHPYSQSSHFT